MIHFEINLIILLFHFPIIIINSFNIFSTFYHFDFTNNLSDLTTINYYLNFKNLKDSFD
jgi:hypothetical protein